MAENHAVLALAGVPRVNLMPRAESERRERAALTRVWALATIGAVVVALVVVGGAFFLRLTADQALATEKARTSTLLTELAAKSDVTAAITARDTRESLRVQAMANDFAWTPLMGELIGALPAGVTVLEFSLAPGLAPGDADADTQQGASGRLIFSTTDPRSQAATVAALAAVDGVLSADAGELATSGEGTFEFAVDLVLDQTIYSGDFVADRSAD